MIDEVQEQMDANKDLREAFLKYERTRLAQEREARAKAKIVKSAWDEVFGPSKVEKGQNSFLVDTLDDLMEALGFSNVQATYPTQTPTHQDQGYCFVHSFDPDSPKNGGITAVYRPSVKRKGSKMADLAVAVCKEGTSYSRKQGRELCISRLQNGEYIELPLFAVDRPNLTVRGFLDILNGFYG